MKRTVTVGGRELIYELTHKKIKNLNMRIHRDGCVYVSVPLCVSNKAADAFVCSRAEWIFEHLERCYALDENKFNICNGGSVHLFGKDRHLIITESDYLMCGLDGEHIVISLPHPDDTEAVRVALNNLFERIFNEVLLQICNDVYEKHFEDIGIPFPEIKTRKMKARWGSCHVQKNILIFNKSLVFAPEKCIEYVVCHEFTHFLYPDHSSYFHSALEKIFPEAKSCKSLLKTYSNAFEYIF